MKRTEGQWPNQEDLDKMYSQAPENWNRMTDESLDEMSEHYKEENKKK